MNWDELEEGDALVSEVGELVWFVTRVTERAVLCRDLEWNLATPVKRRPGHAPQDLQVKAGTKRSGAKAHVASYRNRTAQTFVDRWRITVLIWQ